MGVYHINAKQTVEETQQVLRQSRQLLDETAKLLKQTKDVCRTSTALLKNQPEFILWDEK